jgi:hypothetical protein
MPLPAEIITARQKMNQAEEALRDYVDSGEHDLDKRRVLVVNLRRSIHDYEDSVNRLLRP